MYTARPISVKIKVDLREVVQIEVDVNLLGKREEAHPGDAIVHLQVTGQAANKVEHFLKLLLGNAARRVHGEDHIHGLVTS